jgi:hypothetical protein
MPVKIKITNFGGVVEDVLVGKTAEILTYDDETKLYTAKLDNYDELVYLFIDEFEAL